MGKQVKKHGYSCKLVRVVDGDTCDAMIDLEFGFCWFFCIWLDAFNVIVQELG